MQKLVTLGICSAKNTKRYDSNGDEYPEKLFSKVSDWLLEQEVDCIVAGCTDINAVFFKHEWKGVSYIDSLNVLAKSIYNDYNKKTN